MPAKTLKSFLDKQRVKYVSIQHSTAYTASEIAASAHVSGRDFAKTVIVMIENEMAKFWNSPMRRESSWA